MHPISTQLIALMRQHHNPSKAKAMKQYLRNQFECWGIDSLLRKTIQQDSLKEIAKLPWEIKAGIVKDLWSIPQREAQYIALEIIKHKAFAKHPLALEQAEYLLLEKSWWDTVDAIAAHLVGNIFILSPEKEKSTISAWLQSDNIWLNRTTLIYQLFYKTSTNENTLEANILSLNHKQDFFIQKAIGWSLRQYARVNPDWVIEFVNETPLSNLAQREALKYF